MNGTKENAKVYNGKDTKNKREQNEKASNCHKTAIQGKDGAGAPGDFEGLAAICTFGFQKKRYNENDPVCRPGRKKDGASRAHTKKKNCFEPRL